jgi:hypothetical protein
MTSGAGLATIVFAILGNSFTEGHYAEAGATGTFHGGNSGHKNAPGILGDEYILTSD